MAKPKQKKKSKKKKVVDSRGIATIKATFNNTHISITDKFGNVIAWSTAGTSGFKGSRKSTSYAATVAAENVANEVISMGLMSIDVRVKGPGSGRESAVRSLASAGLKVMSIKDVTVVITSFKSDDKIFGCLNSIDNQCQVILVENSSDIKIKEKIEKQFKNVNCILSGENLGYGKANNIGLKKVKSKYAFP